MEMRVPPTDTRPWYHQFWPWFLIGILVWAVITGLATAYLAFSTFDGVVVDDYYKQGLMINRVLERDRQAKALKLEAVVSMDLSDHRVRVRLLADKVPERVPELHMELLHPTRGNLDLSLVLEGDGRGDYMARLPEDLVAANWHVILEPSQAQWRLHGRIELPRETGAVFRPQL